MNNIGKKIRDIRTAKGMTQKEVADKCGMADSAIRKYESGRQEPKLSTLEKIASALNIGVSDLLGKSEIIHESAKTVNEAFSVYDKYRGLLDEVLSSGKLPENYVDEIRKQCPTKAELNFAFDVTSTMGTNYMLKQLITPKINFLTNEELHTINTLIEVLTKDRLAKDGNIIF